MVNSSSKAKILLGKLFVYILIALVVGAGVWFLAISPYLTRQEKSRFESARSELKQLAEEIQTKTGKAESIKSNESCGYASAKFSRGDRSCGVSLSIHYPGFTLTKSNEVMSDIANLKGGKIYPGAGNMDQEKFIDSDDFRQSFSQQFAISNLLCSISYEYTDITKMSVNPGETVTGIIIGLRCGGPARAEHYPVKD